MSTAVDQIVRIQTQHGPAEVISFTGLEDNKEHVVFAFGDWRTAAVPKVRIHSECLTGDVFASQRCDCGPQLQEAIQQFSESSGLIVYLRQEGRGIGLLNKMRAYTLQDQGLDTYEANRKLGFEDDQRDFKVAAQMLRAIGLNQVMLLSNNPRKVRHLEQNGIRVSHRIFTKTYINSYNRRYLNAKSKDGGHDGLSLSLSKGVAK